MKSNRFAAIILAGGFSSRAGSFKPLLTIDGITFTDRVISTYLKSNVEVYLLVGYRGEELRAAIISTNVQIVENPDFSQGMFSSIKTALRNLPKRIDSFFITPVDIPLVRPFTIQRLMKKAKENPGKIIYPTYNQTRGHPTLIPALIIPSILSWEEEGGLKSLLHSYQENELEVPVPDRYILFDVDTPEDYQELLESFPHYQVPTEEECQIILMSIGGVSPEIRRHSFKVADIAVIIGQALTVAGTNLDLEVIQAGALLHDIVKSQPDHATLGGRLLSEMGFGKIADAVAAHSDLPAGIHGTSLEAKVVYLADKYVKEDTLVPLEDRFQSAVQRFGADSEAKANLLRRRQSAFNVKNEIEILLDQSVESVLFH